MKVRDFLYHLADLFSEIKEFTLRWSERLLLLISCILFGVIIYDIGFLKDSLSLTPFYTVGLLTYGVLFFIRIHLQLAKKIRIGVYLIELLLLLLLVFYLLNIKFLYSWFATNAPYLEFMGHRLIMLMVIAIIFIIEFSKYSLHLFKLNFNPALLFVLSFVFVIALGTGFLMLPHSTTNGISFIDALFTSTSAVCVTGLNSVSTPYAFTAMGKSVIMILIQIGGLGIMTFTSLFGFFFKGGSFQNHIFIKDLINAEKASEVFKTLIKIMLFTFAIEFVGGLLIYFSIDPKIIPDMLDRVQFSAFHAVSGFCNAGFSTLNDNLYDVNFRFNYNIHLIIAFLIIVGGIGFPIMINFYHYIKISTKNRIRHILSIKRYEYIPRIINVNTKIVLGTTLLLLIFGTIMFFVLEYNNTLAEHSFYGKVVESFFNSVTPRTAGFNTVNMGNLLSPTILIIIFLMWVGASPASTGGGIKTTTFAVAILNTISLARGKDRVEVFKREINSDSIRRAFVVILLSSVVLGIAVFLLTIFEPDKDVVSLCFECFSAYGTVGLSLNLTMQLSTASKYVLVVVMILGRVGTLTLIIGMLRQVKFLHYHYPSEGIYIN